MKLSRKILAIALALLASSAVSAAGSAGVEHHTRSFLDALAKGGGQPIETLAPSAARAVLVGAQAGAALPPADVSEKTITVNGQPLKLTIVRPVGAQGILPAFMFFPGAAGFWATSPPTSAWCATS